MTDALAMRTGGLSQAAGATPSATGQIGQSASNYAVLGSGYLAAGRGLGPWAARLQPASWRGIPFAVRSSLIRRGRRVAIHEYPFRDDVWVEDLGRGTRMVSFSAFLIGDDVFAQRDAMAAAAETEGAGRLVHPSLGAMTATLVEFSAGERADLGRVVEIEFSFVQGSQDQPLYPTTVISTQSAVGVASAAGLASFASDFQSDVAGAIAIGTSAVQGAIGSVVGFVAQVVGTAQALTLLGETVVSLPATVVSTVLGAAGSVLGLANDAGITFGAVAGLVGVYGRYAGGGVTTPLPSTATAASQIAVLTANRATVQATMEAVLAAGISAPATLPAAVATAVAAFQDCVASPADQLRLLANLAAFSPTIAASTAPIGAATATLQTGIAALVRRTACAALATAAAGYQPSSYDDAMAQLDAVTTLLDAEALAAADAGDTTSFLALRTLRTAVADDLLTRGAQLASLRTVTTPLPLPSLTLAYRLYGDATRSDDLIARADPVHPLFMPISFKVLSR